ncbi:MAG: hypothetical protein DRI26_01155 [Chloroflexi bacterium]|nr:MAG: hypothetical protein DRI26_01155 [Chloroflexota bacterium]
MRMSDFEEILPKLEGFTPVERVLLTCSGTLEIALSAYLGEPVDVEVVEQREDGEVISRRVRLRGRNSGRIACEATSQVIVLDGKLKDEILSKKIGLGQALIKHGIRPEFQMLDLGKTDDSFYRLYRLVAPRVVYRIKESFPRRLYD